MRENEEKENFVGLKPKSVGAWLAKAQTSSLTFFYLINCLYKIYFRELVFYVWKLIATLTNKDFYIIIFLIRFSPRTNKKKCMVKLLNYFEIQWEVKNHKLQNEHLNF